MQSDSKNPVRQGIGVICYSLVLLWSPSYLVLLVFFIVWLSFLRNSWLRGTGEDSQPCFDLGALHAETLNITLIIPKKINQQFGTPTPTPPEDLLNPFSVSFLIRSRFTNLGVWVPFLDFPLETDNKARFAKFSGVGGGGENILLWKVYMQV